MSWFTKGLKREHACEDEGTLQNVRSHTNEIESPIEPDVREQVKRAVKEGKQPKHSSYFYQGIDAKDLSQRSDRHCQTEKDQRQHASRRGDELKWIRANSLVIKIPQEKHERYQSVHKDDDF